MKALVFAAGLGTRLRPFTLEHPKALVPVGGTPMLQRVITKLIAAGITEIVVNVHHFSAQIASFLRANHNFGANIRISDESSRLLDTGGGILRARPWLDDEPFLVHNADILTDFPIAEILKSHDASSADVTLLVSQRQTSRYLLFDSDGRMAGWQNVKTGEALPAGISPELYAPLAFGGVHVWSPSVFPRLEEYARAAQTEAFPVVPFYVSACRALRIMAYSPSAPYHWHDVGSPAALAAAEASLSL